MDAVDYSHAAEVHADFAEVVAATREELAAEGFGVLTEVDVKATLKAKIDVDRDDYVILGACNPGLAHQALQAEPELGVFLPCNVVVYRTGDATRVSAVSAEQMLGLVENDALTPVAREVSEKLQRVVAAVAARY